MADTSGTNVVGVEAKPSTSTERRKSGGGRGGQSSGTASAPKSASGSSGKMEFVPGALIEARDFADNWFPSKIVEVDPEGREVLVHFQNWSSRYDEWISMDSARLRPQTNQSEKTQPFKVARGKDFKIGEKVMALWHNNKRYPAKIQKNVEPGIFEVIFYDGFVMPVKAKHMTRIPKEQADTMEIPFPPPSEGEKLIDMEELGSKEERRKRKKKIEVAELFRYYKKRPSTDNPKDGVSPTPSTAASSSTVKEEEGDDQRPESETPSEDPAAHQLSGSEAGTSVPEQSQTNATAFCSKKKKKKKKKGAKVEPTQKFCIKDQNDVFKLKDDKLPDGWEKRAKLKTVGSKAGKWDVIIVGPEGRTFRSKQDIKQYLFVRQLDHDLELFDFRLGPDFYISRGMPVPKRALNPLSRPSSSPVVKKEDTATATIAAVASSPNVPVTPLGPTGPGTPPLNASATESPSQATRSATAKSEHSTPAGYQESPETQTIVPEEASGGFRCPLPDCRKLFRRDNLLVMHIKHYHPALLKKLGCKTVRVEDLAAARTAFETDDVVPTPKAAQAAASAVAPSTATTTQPSSILASILTVPPSSSTPSLQQQQIATPSPPPTTRPRLSSERRSAESKWATPVTPDPTLTSEDVPLSKRVSLSHSSSWSGRSSTRRRSDRRAQHEQLQLPEDVANQRESSASMLDQQAQEMELGDGEGAADGTKLDREEPIVVSTLDDIPGQKELVHCFCGSPEEDGLMIQCELCLCWQHGICLAIDREENVPDPYVCHFCRYPFRERLSRRYTHDQSWLKKGQLPSLKFISGASSVPADRTLRVAHTLTAAATDLKQLLHSLKVKIDIAKNKDHPKLYLWAQPWNKKTENDASSSPSPDAAAAPSLPQEEDKTFVPNIPLPETPIDATDCRLNLLMHITDTQQEVDARLETLEGLFEECETEEPPLDTSQMAKMLQILLKDVVTLKKMASFSWGS